MSVNKTLASEKQDIVKFQNTFTVTIYQAFITKSIHFSYGKEKVLSKWKTGENLNRIAGNL